MPPIRLMTIAPGHFHAALVQKRSVPGIARRSYVYAPLDADLVAHLDRLASFNARAEEPTDWEIDVRAGAGYLERFLHEQPGNTVVLSGRNRPKIDVMAAAVRNGLHVLADKPWVIEAADFPKLEKLLGEAESREVLVWDMLTERHEVTSRLQRDLIRDREIFGDWLAGSPAQPALALTSVHHLKKTVAGRPLRRPWWWFDAGVSGEAMADVGTHLADLALWLAFPDQAIDHRTEVAVVDADGWSLVLSAGQFEDVTGLAAYPGELFGQVVGGLLNYAGNNRCAVVVRGLHVRLTTLWEYEAPSGGGDTHQALARGSKATVAVRQEPGGVPELFIAAAGPAGHKPLAQALTGRCAAWQRLFPGVQIEDRGDELRLAIPAALRVGHELHFAEVMEEFARYFHTPRAVPSWERSNALARYFITTRAVEIARGKRGMVDSSQNPQ